MEIRLTRAYISDQAVCLSGLNKTYRIRFGFFFGLGRFVIYFYLVISLLASFCMRSLAHLTLSYIFQCIVLAMTTNWFSSLLLFSSRCCCSYFFLIYFVFFICVTCRSHSKFYWVFIIPHDERTKNNTTSKYI